MTIVETEAISPATPQDVDDVPSPEGDQSIPAAELPVLPAPPEFPAKPNLTGKDDYFTNSGSCIACHTVLKDNAGNEISMDTTWRSSIKAQAAVDPYYLATVRSEIEQHPELRAVIEDTCASCHMPMAATSIHFEGGQAAILDDGLLDPEAAKHDLGIEGVSCNLCHQIRADNLGTEESFSAGYVIDSDLPMGQRPSYGRFPVTKQYETLMSGGSGFLPVQSDHIQKSELCATCHNLLTPYLDENDDIAGIFPEQMVYSEWLNSDYAGSFSCQDCHMPVIKGEYAITSLSTPARAPFHQHLFQGGNAYMLRIFQYFGEEIGISASSEQLINTLVATEGLLQAKTAAIELENLKISEGRLTGEIMVKNFSGHKFPTSYPSRRAWLLIRLVDDQDRIIFESGGYSAEGMIDENDNDRDANLFEPHHEAITSSEQVQIYELIMGNTQGQVTTNLLKGSQYLKDNRLLPTGFPVDDVDVNIKI